MNGTSKRAPVERIVGRLRQYVILRTEADSDSRRHDLMLDAADEIERLGHIEADASEIIGSMAAVIFGMYVIGPEGSHNGKPYRDIAAELKAAENAAEVRAALGLPPNAVLSRAADGADGCDQRAGVG